LTSKAKDATNAATEDLELAGALLSHPTIRAAAEAAGVSESTIYRRLRDSAFRKELKEQRLRVYSHALQRLQVAAEGAVDVLEEVMQDDKAPLSARIKCAVHVLERADKGPQPEWVDRRLQTATESMLEDL
jgi:AcrR family transcriptional regulator